MTLLKEAITSAAFPKAGMLIAQYLRKNVTRQVFLYPEPEHFISAGKHGVGIRYFLGKKESIRFNWLSDTSVDSSKNLVSVTYWDGSRFDGKPSYTIKFERAQSLAKSLPMIVDFLKSPATGEVLYMEEASLMESVLANVISPDFTQLKEAKVAGGNVIPTIHSVIRAFGQGMQLKDMRNDSSIGGNYGNVVKVMRTIYPDFFEKQGVSVVFTNKSNASKLSVEKIINALGVSGVQATVTAGDVEVLVASKETEAMEANIPALAFEEQLGDLRRSMALLMQGATNGLFVAGKPGVGKTQTIEDELHARGLEDGSGYFKITGSASTAGIYRLLYEHRNDILLFDDSDGALADQDSRNLFKAATDTKKLRKLAWMKAGKNYVDPADMDDDEEGGSSDLLPRYFDFKGKIIFISNLKMDKLDPDQALRTRAMVINIWPTDNEVIDFMMKIAPKIKLDVDYNMSEAARLEVCDVIRSRPVKKDSVNLRMLVRGLNIRAGIEKDGGSDWLPMVTRYA